MRDGWRGEYRVRPGRPVVRRDCTHELRTLRRRGSGRSRRRLPAHSGDPRWAKTVGGFVFATWLYYTLVADVYLGAFYGLAYAIATVGIPPAFAAQYNALLPIAFGVGAVSLYAVEGTVAGALVPPEWITPPPFYPS